MSNAVESFCYVIGDIQGCYEELRALVHEIGFNEEKDRLWVVGDLINRGGRNVEVLRFLKGLGERAVCVLGNHDIFLLAVVAGIASLSADDTLQDLLEAPDLDDLVEWLRRLPLLHVEGSYAMVHAGLLPQWSVEQARQLAADVEQGLSSDGWREFLIQLWGEGGACAWRNDLAGAERLRVIVNSMTRLRFLKPDGCFELAPKGPPEEVSSLVPWFAFPHALWQTHTILHGHWSALGFRDMGKVVALDSGCVWGGGLTAFRLHDRAVWCSSFVGKAKGVGAVSGHGA